MDNNNPNKAKFFAQYLDCCHIHIKCRNEKIARQMMCSPTQIEWIKYNNVPKVADNSTTVNANTIPRAIETSHLLLTPLQYLAESDAIQAISIGGMINSERFGYLTEHSDPKKIIEAIKEIKIWRLDVADYLRSQGYALPYLNLSVEQLVERGWVVLIK